VGVYLQLYEPEGGHEASSILSAHKYKAPPYKIYSPGRRDVRNLYTSLYSISINRYSLCSVTIPIFGLMVPAWQSSYLISWQTNRTRSHMLFSFTELRARSKSK